MRGGGGRWGWVGSQSNHSDSSSTPVPSVWYLNWSNPQGGPRLPSGAVWSYLCPSGLRNAFSWFNSIRKKLFVKADLAIYGQVLGISGVLLSCTDKKWILVDVRIRPVFPDLLTNLTTTTFPRRLIFSICHCDASSQLLLNTNLYSGC